MTSGYHKIISRTGRLTIRTVDEAAGQSRDGTKTFSPQYVEDLKGEPARRSSLFTTEAEGSTRIPG